MIDGRRRRYLFAIVLLALLLFNAPLLIVMDAMDGGGSLPAYLFVAWTLVIALTALVMHWRARS
jgi:hypothetical protein